MRDDYRWIFERAKQHSEFPENAEEHLRDILLEAEGREEDIPVEMKIRDIILFPSIESLPAEQREEVTRLVRVWMEDQRKRYEQVLLAVLRGKLNKAVNILVQYNGPECKFVEIEDDNGAGLSIGEHIQDSTYPEMTRIRITAANLINMKDVT